VRITEGKDDSYEDYTDIIIPWRKLDLPEPLAPKKRLRPLLNSTGSSSLS